MTDREKLTALRAEIERLFEKAGESLGEYRNGAEHTLITLSDFINSLPEEPVSEDLKKEFDDIYYKLEKEYARKTGLAGYYKGYNFSLKIARHFANWQAEQFEKNRLAACDAQTVEEAEIERDFVMGIIEKEHRQPTFDDAIKYGMRLQKNQGYTKIETVNEIPISYSTNRFLGVCLFTKYAPFDSFFRNCKQGDKVIVQIMKKED